MKLIIGSELPGGKFSPFDKRFPGISAFLGILPPTFLIEVILKAVSGCIRCSLAEWHWRIL
jgi:hypothetical protein